MRAVMNNQSMWLGEEGETGPCCETLRNEAVRSQF